MSYLDDDLMMDDETGDDPVSSFLSRFGGRYRKPVKPTRRYGPPVPEPKKRAVFTEPGGRGAQLLPEVRVEHDPHVAERQFEALAKGVSAAGEGLSARHLPPTRAAMLIGDEILGLAGGATRAGSQIADRVGAHDAAGAMLEGAEHVDRTQDKLRNYMGDPVHGGELAADMVTRLGTIAGEYKAAGSIAGRLLPKVGEFLGAGDKLPFSTLFKGNRGSKAASLAKEIGAGMVTTAPLDIAFSQNDRTSTAQALSDFGVISPETARDPIKRAGIELTAGNALMGAVGAGAMVGKGIKKLSKAAQAREITDRVLGRVIGSDGRFIPDAGFTINPRLPAGKDDVAAGYLVGMGGAGYPRAEIVDPNPDKIRRVIQKIHGALDRDDVHIGGWVDPETNKLVLEPSRQFDNRAAAVRVGLALGEKGIASFPGGAYKYIDLQDLRARGITAETADFGLSPELLSSTGTHTIPKVKGKLAAGFTPANADRQVQQLATVAASHPDPLATADSWQRVWTDPESFGPRGHIPPPPTTVLEEVANPELITQRIGRMRPEQVRASLDGMASTRRVGEALRQASPEDAAETVATLLLWNNLSAGLSPYPHESAWVNAHGALKQAISDIGHGVYNPDLAAAGVARMLAGTPGAQATHTSNRFFKQTLPGLFQPGPDGRKSIEVLTELLQSDRPSAEIRREMLKLAKTHGATGADTKIASFILLMSGRNDVVVPDRVLTRRMWNGSGRYDIANLYDDGGFSTFLSGPPGLLATESIERSLAPRVQPALAAAGIPPEFQTLGAYHWLTWVDASAQDVGHDTIDAIAKIAAGDPSALDHVIARQGKYSTYGSGAFYGNIDGKPAYGFTSSTGVDYLMTPQAYAEAQVRFQKLALAKDRSFKVSDASTKPWYAQRYDYADGRDAIIRELGTPSPIALGRAVEAPALRGAPARPRQLAAGPRSGAVDPVALLKVGATAAGAVAGPLFTDDDPKGVAIGALIGYGGGRLAAHFVTRGVRSALRAGLTNPRDVEALARAGSLVDWGGKSQEALDRALSPRLVDRIRFRLDAYSPIDDLGNAAHEAGLRPTQNPRYLLTHVLSSDTRVETAFDHGIPDFMSGQPMAPSLKAVFEPIGNDPDDVTTALTYLVSKRKVGRVQRMGGQAVGQDAQQFADAQAVVAALSNNPKVQEFETRWNAMMDGLGKYAVDSGMWTPDQWQAIWQSDAIYVPFKRVIETWNKSGPRTTTVGKGSALVNVTPGVIRFKGSEKQVSDVASATAQYIDSIIRRSNRYAVGASLFDAADALGIEGERVLTRIPASQWSRGQEWENSIQALQAAGIETDIATEVAGLHVPLMDKHNPVIWRNLPNGEKEYARIQQPLLWKAVSLLKPDREALSPVLRVALGALKGAKRTFTATTTGLNVRFSAGTNVIRDMVQAYQQSQTGLQMTDIARKMFTALSASGAGSVILGAGAGAAAGAALDPGDRSEGAHAGAVLGALAGAKGAKYLTGAKSKAQVEMMARAGGIGSTSLIERSIRPEDAVRRYAPTTRSMRFRKVLSDIVRRPLEALETVTEVSDRAPRMAEFESALRSTEPKVASGQWSVADQRLYAATHARQATIDFHRKAGDPTLAAIAEYIPFFNVGLQAPVRYGKAWKDAPGRMAGVSAGVAILAGAAWALKQKDQETAYAINDRVSTERAAFLMFPFPGDLTVRVPLGQENGLVAGAVTYGLDKLAGDDPHAGDMLREAFLRVVPNPFAVPVGQQVVEIMRNEAFYGNRPIEPKSMEGLLPLERRRDTTAPTFDLLARGAGKVGMDLSPLQVEHLVRGTTSSFTPALTSLTDPVARRMGALKDVDAVPPPATADPMNPLGVFKARTPPGETMSERDYYEARERLGQAGNTERLFNRQLESLDENDTQTYDQLVERVQRFVKGEQPWLSPAAREVQAGADEQIATIRDAESQIRLAYRSGKIPSSEANEKLDILRGMRQQLFRQSMTEFHQTGLPVPAYRQP